MKAGLPLTLNLDQKPVLLVGGDDDEETERRAKMLEDCGAVVRRVSAFTDRDVEDVHLVIVTSPALAPAVYEAARARGVLCWSRDDVAHSDFSMNAIANLGPARIAITTSGSSPALAARMRAAFEDQLGPRFAAFVEALGKRRSKAARKSADSMEAIDGFEIEMRVTYPRWFND